MKRIYECGRVFAIGLVLFSNPLVANADECELPPSRVVCADTQGRAHVWEDPGARPHDTGNVCFCHPASCDENGALVPSSCEWSWEG